MLTSLIVQYCPGDFVGELSILSEAEAFLGVHAKAKTLLVQIPRALVLRLLEVPAGRGALSVLIKASGKGEPVDCVCLGACAMYYLGLTFCMQLNMRILSPLVRQVDFALDWMHLDAGQRVFSQGRELQETETG